MLEERVRFICYYWVENIDKIGFIIKNKFTPDSLLLRTKMVLVELLKSFYRLVKAQTKPKIKDNNKFNTLIYITTQNHYNSSNVLYNNIEHVAFLKPHNVHIEMNNEDYININFKYTLLFKFKYLKKYLIMLKNNSTYRRIFNIIFESIGLYESSKNILNNLQCNYLILLNDHSLKNRAMLLACKELGIKTIYLQHSPVNEKFPPLEFNYSLLDGPHSQNVYRNSGSKIISVFPDRYKKYIQNKITYPKLNISVGIAVNILDDLKEVQRLIKSLECTINLKKIVLRPHPGDKRDYKDILKNTNAELSTEPTSLKMLSNVQVLISGNSGIHLEACLMNVQSIFYDFGKSNFSDSYNFVENGLSVYVKDIKQIKQFLNNYDFDADYYLKSKKYVDLNAPSAHKIVSRIIEENSIFK